MNPTLEQRLLESKGGSSTSSTYGKVATSEAEKQANRLSLQSSLKSLGTDSTITGGNVVVKPVTSISSSNGANAINTGITDHNNEIAKMTPPTQGADGKPAVDAKTAKKNKSIEEIGGITSEEANTSGADLSTYTYDSKSGYFIPTTKVETDKAEKAYKDAEDEVESTFGTLTKSMDSTTKNLIDSYRSTFAENIAEQKKMNEAQSRSANTLNIRTGIARYAPNQASAVISAVEKEGLDRIKKIGVEEAQLIAQAQQSLQDKKYDVFMSQRAELKALRKERTDAITKIQDKALEELKLKREENKKTQDELDKNRSNILIELGKTGNVPKEVFDAVSSATDVNGMVQAAGDYLQGGSGIVGEYNMYKRDSINRGIVPLSFDEYQTRDANRKVSLAKAASATGLDSGTLTKVQSIAGKYDSLEVVKNYQTSAEAIEALKTAGSSPTDDISRIYAFAKVMDPNSAVKEGEYATVQEYSSALLERAGIKAKRIFENTGILTPEARKFMLTTLENRLKASEKAYKNAYDENTRKINKITGATDGADYLTDYTKGFTSIGSNIIQNEEDAQNKISTYLTSNPAKKAEFDKAVDALEATLGRSASSEEFLQVYPEFSE